MTAGNFAHRRLEAKRLVCHCFLNGYTDATCIVLFCWLSVWVCLGQTLKRALCACLKTDWGHSFQLSSAFERIGKQLSKLCSIFISRESGTSESYYHACFEALLCMHNGTDR